VTLLSQFPALMGRKLGIDATKQLPGEGFKRPWPPLIKMDAAVKAKVGKLFNV
jgi:4-hydroxy-3-polyprenylbenzoate decarboxylase